MNHQSDRSARPFSLAALRALLGLDQKTLGRLLGVDSRTVLRLEAPHEVQGDASADSPGPAVRLAWLLTQLPIGELDRVVHHLTSALASAEASPPKAESIITRLRGMPLSPSDRLERAFTLPWSWTYWGTGARANADATARLANEMGFICRPLCRDREHAPDRRDALGLGNVPGLTLLQPGDRVLLAHDDTPIDWFELLEVGPPVGVTHDLPPVFRFIPRHSPEGERLAKENYRLADGRLPDAPGGGWFCGLAVRCLAAPLSTPVTRGPGNRETLTFHVAKDTSISGGTSPTTMPTVVAHCDWSVEAQKRQCCVAIHGEDGWHAGEPGAIHDPMELVTRLIADARGGPILLGCDFPIGVPAAWALRAGVQSFSELLPELGADRWAEFFNIADSAEEIRTERPFYPRRPGGTSKRQLWEALGLDDADSLQRECERTHGGEALFWTLGARQVGRGALHGWRTLLQTALSRPEVEVRLWPFDGDLADLLKPGRLVIVETYPRAFYAPLHIDWVVKTDKASRERAAELLEAATQVIGLGLDESLRTRFGEGFKNDDDFDAVVGLIGMLMVVQGRRSERSKPIAGNALVQRVEGWMFGT